GFGQIRQFVSSVNQPRHAPRQVGIVRGENAMNIGLWLEQNAFGPTFVLRRTRHGPFEQMGQGAVPDIVKKGRCDGVASPLARDPLPERQDRINLTQAAEQELHDVRGPEGMRKAGVLRSWKSERSQAKLPDPPEPLHLWRAEQSKRDCALLAFESDEAV